MEKIITLMTEAIDTTGKRLAEQEWLSHPENYYNQKPIWDNNGNIIGFVAVALLIAFVLVKSRDIYNYIKQINYDFRTN